MPARPLPTPRRARPDVPSAPATRRPAATARATATALPSGPDARLAAIAAGQGGVVSLADTDAAGLSRRTVSRRVAVGHLHRRHQGVFAVGHPGLTPRGEAVAALLACGPGAVLSHASAAALWDLAPWPEVPHVTSTGRHRLAGVQHHEATLPPVTTRRHGLPTTPVEQLLLAVAEQPDGLELPRLLNEALYRRRTTIERVGALLEASPGRHGVAALRLLLPYAGAQHSQLEDRFRRLLGDAGLPRPQGNRRVHGREVDFWWPAERLVVETDGWAAHGTRTAFEVDRDRDAALLARGVVTMRVTARALLERPMVVVARLGAVLLAGRA